MEKKYRITKKNKIAQTDKEITELKKTNDLLLEFIEYQNKKISKLNDKILEFNTKSFKKNKLKRPQDVLKEIQKKYTIGYYLGGIKANQYDTLNIIDKNDVMKKSFYVFWSFRNPKTNKLERQNHIKGGANRLKKFSQRLLVLQNIKLALEEALENGYSPFNNPQETPIKYIENIKKNKKEYLKKWREKNKEKVKRQVKEYQESNKEEIKNYKKKFKEDNKEKANIHAKLRYKTDALFRLKMSARGSVIRYLKNGKSKRTREIIGLDFKEFQDYLKVEYTEGMHLDHIIPLSWAIIDEEVYTLNHYSNFQILTAEENLAKQDLYCKSENLKKVLDNHNNLTKVNKIIERNSDKIT